MKDKMLHKLNFLIILFLIGFSLNEIYSQCKADFSFDINENEVNFQNLSVGHGEKVLWDLGDLKYDKKATTVKHKYKYPGQYIVTLTIDNEETGCFDQISKTIIVNEDEIECNAKFNFTLIDTALLKYKFANLSKGSGQFTWSFDDGKFSDLFEPEHNFNSPGIYKVKLSLKDKDKKCFSTSKQTIEIKTDSTKIKAKCTYYYDVETDSIYFKNQSTGPSIKFYYWNFGNGIVSKYENPSFSYNEVAGKSFCFTVYDENHKNNTFCGDVSVYKTEEENADFSFNLVENSFKYEFFPIIQDSTCTYSWNFGDEVVSEGMEVTHVYSDTGLYVVTLIKTGQNYITRSYQLVNVNSNISANIAAFVLRPSTLKAEYKTSKPKGILSGDISRFKWSFGDGTYDSTSLSPVHDYYIEDDSVNLCLIVYNDYNNTSETYCKIVQLNNTPAIDSLCNASFNYTIEDTKIELTNLSTGYVNYFKWFFDNTDTIKTTNINEQPNYQFNEYETHSIGLISQIIVDGVLVCSDTLIEKINLQTKIAKNSIANCTLYPNPVTEKLNVVLDIENISEIQFDIIDLSGNIIESRVLNKQPKSKIDINFNTSKLIGGVYILKIIFPSEIQFYKFIKMK